MTANEVETPDAAEDVDTPVDLNPATAVKRKHFHEHDADGLASAVGVKAKRHNKPTEKFAYFKDAERLVVVAGAQEKQEVAHAFARGLGLRGNRRLVLVLPERHSFATMQRAPWFRAGAQPEIWTYGKGAPTKQKLLTREQTQEALRSRLMAKQSLEDELVAATTVKHLGSDSKSVTELVEWATAHERLDASHLKGERSWHCLGQKVLSIKGTGAGPAIRAGVHYSGSKAPKPLVITSLDALSPGKLKKVQAAVEAGIALRLDSDDRQIHKADEHWLQAVIRRDPKLVGVEQPALREVPAWRPRDDSKQWGRGFIDLMGIDGHGNIRIVETKVARNTDEMLILQGLDYYVWAQVYGKEVRRRLSASPRSKFEIHYVVGDSAGDIHVHPHAHAQVSALIDKITWRFQTVDGWYGHPDTTARAKSTLLGEGLLPPAKGDPST